MSLRADDMTDLCFLDREDGEKLAYRQAAGAGPGIVWVGGFRSDMEGTKAAFVADWAARKGRACLRFDYYAHGGSTGDFAKGTLTRWLDDALTAFDRLSTGKQIVVGSSMGGWISNLLVRARPERVAGVIWLAPAPDFTEGLIWDLMAEEVRREVMDKGQWLYTSEDESYPITRALIESGRKHLVLDRPLKVSFPVRILHGMADRDVPWRRTLKLVETLEGDVRVTFLKNSEHRLSSPADIKLLEQTLDALAEEIGA